MAGFKSTRATTIECNETYFNFRLKITDSDEDLMTAFARGDADAFEVVFERHRSWLVRMLKGKVRACGLSGEELAEDIAQDTWLTVVRTSEQYEPSARFTTWLFKIAQQRLIDQLRKLGVVASYTAEGFDQSDFDESARGDESAINEIAGAIDIDPARIVEHRAMLTRFSEVLQQLPLVQSEVFMLVAEGGMSLPEVAENLSLPLETVKSRLRYARAKLAKVIEELRS
jgi:RNA polymerase sigma factor (sigma-70 family)